MPTIYLPTVSLASFSKLCIKNLSLHVTNNEVIFYCKTGIFLLRKNIFHRMIINQKSVESFELGGIEILADMSTITYEPIYSQLPNDYEMRVIKRNNYMLAGFNDIKFVIVSNLDKNIDCYIESYSNINKLDLDVILCSFLS